MGSADSTDFNKVLPESFYDLLAYIIPFSYFIGSLIYLIEGEIPLSKINSFTPDSVFFQALLSLIGLGLMYVGGQVATSLSFFIISRPVSWILHKLKKLSSNKFSIIEFWFEIRTQNTPSVQAEIAKRIGRWVMTRNIAFLSLILIFYSGFAAGCSFIFVFISIFIVSLIDFSIRTVWLERSFKETLALVR